MNRTLLKRFSFVSSLILLGLASCQNNSSLSDIVSQKYVHKYGFPLSEKEWEDRAAEGQVVSTLKNGVKQVQSYEDGELHVTTTYSFPHSHVVERMCVYDQGTLLKEVQFDLEGIPIRETVYEFDDRTLITCWGGNGAPLSIEEYEGACLIEGKYYNPNHELEGTVSEGFGERYQRNRSGELLFKDQIEKGLVATRTTYHLSGHIQAISNYLGEERHGEELKYTKTGKPLMQLSWEHGVLDGIKTVFRNGQKIAEIPYVKGHKQGVESHFDDLGTLTAEIEWKGDKKHGMCKYYTDEGAETEWFYQGKPVSAKKYQKLMHRDQVIAELSLD